MKLIDRFLAGFELNEATGCWTWIKGRNQRGYGKFAVTPSDQWYAHRFAYVWFVGPIEIGKQVDHICQNPSCVNPLHLQLLSPKDNNAKSNSPSAKNKKKTHCIHGHEFSKENTFYVENRRQCKVCSILRKRKYRQNKRIEQL